MTDRYYTLTVTLDKEIREDDAQPIIDAIKMVKGVGSVNPLIAKPELYFAKEMARRELLDQVNRYLIKEGG